MTAGLGSKILTVTKETIQAQVVAKAKFPQGVAYKTVYPPSCNSGEVCSNTRERVISITIRANVVRPACLLTIVIDCSIDSACLVIIVCGVVQARLCFARKEEDGCCQGKDGEQRSHLAEWPRTRIWKLKASMYKYMKYWDRVQSPKWQVSSVEGGLYSA